MALPRRQTEHTNNYHLGTTIIGSTIKQKRSESCEHNNSVDFFYLRLQYTTISVGLSMEKYIFVWWGQVIGFVIGRKVLLSWGEKILNTASIPPLATLSRTLPVIFWVFFPKGTTFLSLLYKIFYCLQFDNVFYLCYNVGVLEKGNQVPRRPACMFFDNL